MKIEFFNTGLSRNINKIGEFEITTDLTLRILEDKDKISVKLRNVKFTQTGRILKIDGLENVNKISFAGVDYTDIKYTQHEVYIHQPSDGDLALDMSEDLNITFKKVVVADEQQQ